MTDKLHETLTRRELFAIGNVLAMPVLLGGVNLHAEEPATPKLGNEVGGAEMGPLTPGPEIYQSIGVEPIINCRGTFTIIGGSVERPEVRAAMDAASKYFVQIDELAGAVGQRLAELTGAEWGMVSAGCAAGLKHVTAACVTGGNPERLIRIPDLTGFDRTEVVSPRYSRNVYDAAVRNIGVTMITRPRTLPRLLGVDSATASRMAWSAQMLGAREVALGLGAFVALRRPDRRAARLWLLAGLVSDAVDALAVGAAVAQGRVSKVTGTGLVAVAGGAVYAQLDALQAAEEA